MATASFAEDLTCSVCLCVFTDPVTALCGHSFCRKCITDCPIANCPQCRAVLPSTDEVKRLPTSHILKSLAEKAKEAGQQGPAAQGGQWLCPDHDEKLKLFCLTDEQLACIICRDGEKHDGHKFKPIKEAAASLRKNLDLGLVDLLGQIDVIENLTQTQGQEINKAKKMSGQLMLQIHRQFEEMHQFLRRREDEIKNELKNKEEDAVQNMTKSLNAMNRALTECRELRESWAESLKNTDSEQFLKSWTEANSSMSFEDLSRSRSSDLFVVQSPVFKGPYQSHLQFFMWKEMLQVVQPRAEMLTLRNDSVNLTVSDDRRSLHSARKDRSQYGYDNKARGVLFGQSQSFVQSPFQSSHNYTAPQNVFSSNEFLTGQHYWEVEVGHRDYWCLGIKDYFLKYDNQTYSACEAQETTELTVNSRPRKIGIYLDCSSKGLSFYDADNMIRVHTVHSSTMSLPVSAYFSVRCKEPDPNPMKVCWY